MASADDIHQLPNIPTDSTQIPAPGQGTTESLTTDTLAANQLHHDLRIHTLENSYITPHTLSVYMVDGLVHLAEISLEDIGQYRCQICTEVVPLNLFQRFVERHRTQDLRDNGLLKIRDQQQFCMFHQVDDSAREWRRRGYPIINWQEIETVRVPRHLAHLRAIVVRKAPSCFRDRLEAASKSSRKDLQKYIRQCSSNAMTGYYGPYGAQLCCHVITENICDLVLECSRRDKLLRSTGIGSYVFTVLLPELFIRLVEEDVVGLSNTRAQEILAVSTGLGALVYPEDSGGVPSTIDKWTETTLSGKSRSSNTAIRCNQRA